MVKTLAITGYKNHELGIFHDSHPGIPLIKKAIEKQLLLLIDEGLEWVIISGQLGVELWAAEVVLHLQQEFKMLKLAVLFPFLEQEKNWNDKNKEKLEEILLHAGFVDSITKRPYESPIQFRLKNEFIIQKTDGLLIIYDDEKEGTPKYMLNQAKKEEEKRDYFIHRISLYDLQVMAEEEQWNE